MKCIGTWKTADIFNYFVEKINWIENKSRTCNALWRKSTSHIQTLTYIHICINTSHFQWRYTHARAHVYTHTNLKIVRNLHSIDISIVKPIVWRIEYTLKHCTQREHTYSSRCWNINIYIWTFSMCVHIECT